MITGSALAAWLADPARQAQTSSDIEAFARSWRDRPILADLRHEIDQMETRSAAALIAAAKRFMGRGPEIGALASDMIAASASNPFFRPPVRLVTSEIHSGLIVFDHPDMTISLGAVPVDALAAAKTSERGSTAVFFTGQWTVLHFIKAGGATLSFWEAPEIHAGFVGDAGDRCRLVGYRRIEDGETIVNDGRSKSFVFHHAASDIVCLQALIGAEAAPLTVGYDSSSLAFAGASSTDEESSRTQMLVTLLRIMDRKDAIPLVREALKSPHFYTRWYIMRELLAFDAEAALPDLVEMASSDPHPEIRAAAAQTLELLRGEPEQAGEEEAVPCHA